MHQNDALLYFETSAIDFPNSLHCVEQIALGLTESQLRGLVHGFPFLIQWI